MSAKPTSDGIAGTDWDNIIALAADIANAGSNDDDELAKHCTEALLVELDELERKYGRLPSILSTRAHYTEDAKHAIPLLLEAWDKALRMQDKNQLLLIASSLAEIFVTDLSDHQNGELWLERLEDMLGDRWDDGEYALARDLREYLAKLDATKRPGQN